MTTDFSEFAERIRAARTQLDVALAQAERDLARFKRENQPTPEEQRQLHEAAQRGDLGEDMRELARRIDAGEDSWQAVFAGESPNIDLLRGHIQRMVSENREAIAQAIDEDEELQQLRREVEELR